MFDLKSFQGAVDEARSGVYGFESSVSVRSITEGGESVLINSKSHGYADWDQEIFAARMSFVPSGVDDPKVGYMLYRQGVIYQPIDEAGGDALELPANWGHTALAPLLWLSDVKEIHEVDDRLIVIVSIPRLLERKEEAISGSLGLAGLADHDSLTISVGLHDGKISELYSVWVSEQEETISENQLKVWPMERVSCDISVSPSRLILLLLEGVV